MDDSDADSLQETQFNSPSFPLPFPETVSPQATAASRDSQLARIVHKGITPSRASTQGYSVHDLKARERASASPSLASQFGRQNRGHSHSTRSIASHHASLPTMTTVPSSNPAHLATRIKVEAADDMQGDQLYGSPTSGKRKTRDEDTTQVTDAQSEAPESEAKRMRQTGHWTVPQASFTEADSRNLEIMSATTLRLVTEMQQLKASNSDLTKAVAALLSKPSLRSDRSRHTSPDSSTQQVPLPRPSAAPPSPSSPMSLSSCKCSDLTHQRIAAYLPDGRLLRGLIGHFLYKVAPMVSFIDPTQVMLDVEEVEEGRETLRLRGAHDTRSLPTRVEDFCIKVAMLLAIVSLAVVHLDSSKASELGITHSKVDRLARELWTRSRHILALLTSLAASTSTTTASFASGMATPIDSYGNILDHKGASSSNAQPKGLALSAENLLDIAAGSIVLLVAASSLTAKLEYLHTLTDTIFYAHAAALDKSDDPALPLVLREYRWQLSAYLCCIDWTAAGICHDSNCLIRPEQLRNPPSILCGFTDGEDEGRAAPLSNSSFCREEHRFRQFAQTRYYLKHALIIGHLSRRIEDCTRRSVQLAPEEAVALCAEMGEMESKLGYYQSYYHFADEIAPRYRYSTADLRSSLEVQQWQLRSQLAQTKFKLYRHQALYLLRTIPTHRLTQVFIDECAEACISVLSLCRSTLTSDGKALAPGPPHSYPHGPEHDLLGAQARRKLYDHAGLRGASVLDGDDGQTTKWGAGTVRKVIQPACAAAVAGQVLLRAMLSQQHQFLQRAQSHGIKEDYQPASAPARFTNRSEGPTDQNVAAATKPPPSGSSMAQAAYWTAPPAGQPSSGATGLRPGGPATLAGAPVAPSGPGATPSGTNCPPTPTRRTAKARLLAWHIQALCSELEHLEDTLELARHKLYEIRQAGVEDGQEG